MDKKISIELSVKKMEIKKILLLQKIKKIDEKIAKLTKKL